MIKQFIKFFKDEDGVTSVEYAIMAALIALVVVVGAEMLGISTNAVFERADGVMTGNPIAQ
jgi:pilus assembly protein Flp/PilA